jgi:nitroreductase
VKPYGARRAMSTLQAIEVFNAIYERRAVRRYKAEPVPRSLLEELVDAAIQAPSAMNVQPWAFVVITGAARLEAYSEPAKKYVAEAVDAANIFHGAPALIVICATSPSAPAAQDCCLAAQNLMLAAFASGLGTCPIGLARPWLSLAATKMEIGIPLSWMPVFPIVVGFPGEQPENHGRRAPQIVWSEGTD